jgi:hypothetical protein
VDQLSDLFAPLLAKPYFPDWLWISLGVVALALAYRPTFREQLKSGRPPGPVALAVLALFLTMVSRRAVPTGDEPHYLIVTQSLLQDGDFDVRNNYEHQDYRAYYPDAIPDPHVIVSGERWYPVHAVGVPLLAAPAYAAAGRLGVVMLLTVFTVAGLRILWSVLRLVGFSPPATALAAAAAGFTLPVLAMAGQVFPEVPAFLLVVVALHAMLAPVPSRWDRLGLLLSLGLLPWLHPKYVLLAGALLLGLIVLRPWRATRGTLLGAAGVVAISVLGHALLSYRWYGAPLPGAPILVTKGVSPADWAPSIIHHFFVAPWVGLSGALLDQQHGLFLASPVYVLAIPGFVMLWRRSRKLALACGLVFASIYLPAGSFGIWYGGYCSPARLLTPTVPALALALAAVLDSAERRVGLLFGMLAVPSVLHAYLMVALPGFTRYGDPGTDHNFFIARLERILGVDLTLFAPSFRHVEPLTWLTAAVYVLASLALRARVMRGERRGPIDTADMARA